jgi:Cdc6-like AAA superfamily ATPase
MFARISPCTSNMSIKDYKQIFQQWGLSDNPFSFTPPDEFDRVAKIFHGRSQELEIALPTLYEGRNVLIRGKWGIGKTALIKTLLHRLQQEVAELNEPMLVLYLGGIPKPTVVDFYRAVLLAVTKSISQHNDSWRSEDAKKVADSLAGIPIDSSKIKQEGGINLGVFNYKASIEPNSSSGGENDVYQQLLDWLKEAEAIYGKVVIAVDDLDKLNSPIVQEVLENSLELFRQGKGKRAFIMTGRGFTDLQEATNFSLGIFSEDINLQRMCNADLRQIVINYLNSVRQQPSDSIAPFTEEALDRIIAAAQGTPRQLNNICEKFLRQAAMKRHLAIDLPVWQTIWGDIQTSIMRDLSPRQQQLLYIAAEQQGLSEDISNATLDRLNALTYTAILPEIQQLESMDLIVRLEDERGIRYVPSRLYLPPATDPN